MNAALEVPDLFCLPVQLIYSRNGVNITSTPVQHYTTAGPVALRLDYNGLSVTYSGATPVPVCTVNTCCPLQSAQIIEPELGLNCFLLHITTFQVSCLA